MYKTIREFIDELKRNARVIALIKYGKRQVDDMTLGEDFDLYVIMNDFHSNVESVHFYIEEVPVDVSLRGHGDLLLDKPISKNDLSLIDGDILFDKSGIISRMLNKSKEKWVIEEEEKKEKNKNEIEWIKFEFKHILDKLKYSVSRNDLYSKFTMNVMIKKLIDTYIELSSVECSTEEEILKFLRDTEPMMYNNLDEFYSTENLNKKYKALCKLSTIVFKSTEGLCNNKEILFLTRDNEIEITNDEKDEIIETLGLNS